MSPSQQENGSCPFPHANHAAPQSPPTPVARLSAPIPKRSKGREWLRILAFFLIPVLVVAVANRLLLRSDAHTYCTFLEITQRDDIELALVGSSVVFSDFNANLITEKTGLEAFDISSIQMSLPGALAATRLMYKTNHPKHVVLILEPVNFFHTTEDIHAQIRMAPILMKHPLIHLRYVLDLCSQDHKYLDRMLLFKSFPVRNLDDVRRNLALRTDPAGVLAASGLTDGLQVYEGRGFLRYTNTSIGYDAQRFTPLRPQLGDTYDGLRAYSMEKLREYKSLCEKNGSELMIVLSPNATAQGLGRSGFLQKNAALAEFCREEGIPCYDMMLARREFIPRLDRYFYDWYHLDGEGADLFSEQFADFLNLCFAGEPVDHLFYASVDEYLDSIDFITNAWLDQSRDGSEALFTAECLYGRTIQPEYAFYLVGENNSLELLQDYSADNQYRCAAGSLSGHLLRVYTRPVGSGEALPEIYAQCRID